MTIRSILFAACVTALTSTHAADQHCEPKKYAELPTTLSSGRPVVIGSLNGIETRFYVDSGSFFSFLSLDLATRLQLPLQDDPTHSRSLGPADAIHAKRTKVQKFSLVGFNADRPLKDIDFLVADQHFGFDVSGRIGQNVVGWADSEYDLANGFIRLFTSYGCGSRSLSYWSSDAATLKIDATSGLSSHFVGTVLVNGKKMRALFDSSFGYSLITRKAAERAGFDRNSEKVTAGQPWIRDPKNKIQNWSWGFDSIALGAEEIKNARIVVADVSYEDLADLVLGLDFFLTHRIYFGKEQKRAYFTRNGGQVFDVSASAAAKTDSSTFDGSAGGDNEPNTAVAFRVRGAASLLRNDLQAALRDLEQAVKLDPHDAENLYQRSIVYWRLKKSDLALADMDRAVMLKPESAEIVYNRGMLRYFNKDAAGAVDDFKTALELSPDNAQYSYQLAEAYERANRTQNAIAIYEQFQSKYTKDSQLSSAALNEACWLRLTKTREFEAALGDCNASVKAKRSARNLDSRGMAWLATGRYDKAAVDYKDALELRPKSAWSLYGLGVAEAHLGQESGAAKHKAEAAALQSSIAEEFRKLGIEAP